MSSLLSRGAGCAAVALVALVFAPSAHAAYANDFAVTVECVEEVSANQYVAHFRWVSAHDQQMTQTGANNTISPSSAGTPPTVFGANSEGTWSSNAASKGATVRWQLGGATASAIWKASPRCYAAPEAQGAPRIVGDFTPGGTITAIAPQFLASAGTWNLRYTWWIGCESAGAGRTLVTDADAIELQPGDVGHAVKVWAQVIEPYAGQPASAVAEGPCDTSRTVGRAPVSTEVPRLSGTPVVGGLVGLAGGAWEADPGITQTVIRWQTCDAVACVDVATTTNGDGYRPVAADVGRTIRALVTASNPVGSLLVATPQSAPVAPAPASGSGLIAPATVGFGDVAEGASATQVVTYTNDGDAPVTVRTGIEGVHAGDFAATGNSCRMATLEPGEACAVELRFAPTHAGARTADLRFDDGERSVVPLRGTGVAGPVAQLSRSAVSFGPVAVGGRSAKQAITVTNAGSAPLLVTEVVRTGAHRSDFSFATSCDPAVPIAPGDQCQVTTTFFPRAAGARTATLQVRSNAAGGAQLVDLVGEGTS